MPKQQNHKDANLKDLFKALRFLVWSGFRASLLYVLNFLVPNGDPLRIGLDAAAHHLERSLDKYEKNKGKPPEKPAELAEEESAAFREKIRKILPDKMFLQSDEDKTSDFP